MEKVQRLRFLKYISSTEWNRKVVNIVKLNHNQVESFMTGNLLGDGNLHNGAFITGQINKDLVMFKEKIFNQYYGFSNSKVTFVPKNVKDGITRQDTWRLYISPNNSFKKLEKKFYGEEGRVCPEKMLNNLCPLGLAIWYADDGTTIQVGYNERTGSSSRRRVQICTDSYTLEEVEMIIDYFEREYGRTSRVDRGNSTYRIQINNLSAQKFLEDISPYFIQYFPSLLYKLDMGYRGESLDNELYVTKEYKELFLKISSHEEFIDRLSEKGYY